MCGGGCGIVLFVGGEECFESVLFDTDSCVMDFEVDMFFGCSDCDGDCAVVGELDGVSDEVEEDLSDAV